VEMIGFLVSAGADVNDIEWEESTPLHWAAKNKCLDAAKVLITAGADFNAKDTSEARTPLHWAAKNGDVAVTQVLLTAGADLNAKDKSEKTPLRLAASNRHVEVVEILVIAEADLTMLNQVLMAFLRITGAKTLKLFVALAVVVVQCSVAALDFLRARDRGEKPEVKALHRMKPFKRNGIPRENCLLAHRQPAPMSTPP